MEYKSTIILEKAGSFAVYAGLRGASDAVISGRKSHQMLGGFQAQVIALNLSSYTNWVKIKELICATHSPIFIHDRIKTPSP